MRHATLAEMPMLEFNETATSSVPSTRWRCIDCPPHAQRAVLPASDHRKMADRAAGEVPLIEPFLALTRAR